MSSTLVGAIGVDCENNKLPAPEASRKHRLPSAAVDVCLYVVSGLHFATRKSRSFLRCIIPQNLIFPSEFAWEQMTATA